MSCYRCFQWVLLLGTGRNGWGWDSDFYVYMREGMFCFYPMLLECKLMCQSKFYFLTGRTRKKINLRVFSSTFLLIALLVLALVKIWFRANTGLHLFSIITVPPSHTQAQYVGLSMLMWQLSTVHIFSPLLSFCQIFWGCFLYVQWCLGGYFLCSGNRQLSP